MRLTCVLGVALLSFVLAGCSRHQPDPAAPRGLSGFGPGPVSAAPKVVGLAGVKAVDRLRAAGFQTIVVKGRWSDERVGLILAEHTIGSSASDATVRLVASMGDHRGRRVYLPGVATCELAPMPDGAACAGGPVLLTRD
jgi:hypothetical protein